MSKNTPKAVHIKKYHNPNDGQMARIAEEHWSVARLIHLTKDFEVLDIPLRHLYLYSTYQQINLREMVMHMRAVQDADLSYPIILDEDGELMDGRHRIMRALLDGETSIKAVRFDENPEPCRRDE